MRIFIITFVLLFIYVVKLRIDIVELNKKVQTHETVKAHVLFQAYYLLWRGTTLAGSGDYEALLASIKTQAAASGRHFFRTLMETTNPNDPQSVNFTLTYSQRVLDFFEEEWCPDEAKRMNMQLSRLKQKGTSELDQETNQEYKFR